MSRVRIKARFLALLGVLLMSFVGLTACIMKDILDETPDKKSSAVGPCGFDKPCTTKGEFCVEPTTGREFVCNEVTFTFGSDCNLNRACDPVKTPGTFPSCTKGGVVLVCDPKTQKLFNPLASDGGPDAAADTTPSADTSLAADSTSSDAGSADSGPADMGLADAGAVETGMEAGPTETSLADSGSIDTGSADTGASDTGTIGTGDSARADTGSADTASSDVATDSGSSADSVADTSPVDTGSADTGVGDTGSTDTASADSGPVDSGSADATPADTTPSDSTITDTGLADTGASPDTSLADTIVADTSPTADTSLAADTGTPSADAASDAGVCGSGTPPVPCKIAAYGCLSPGFTFCDTADSPSVKMECCANPLDTTGKGSWAPVGKCGDPTIPFCWKSAIISSCAMASAGRITAIFSSPVPRPIALAGTMGFKMWTKYPPATLPDSSWDVAKPRCLAPTSSINTMSCDFGPTVSSAKTYFIAGNVKTVADSEFVTWYMNRNDTTGVRTMTGSLIICNGTTVLYGPSSILTTSGSVRWSDEVDPPTGLLKANVLVTHP